MNADELAQLAELKTQYEQLLADVQQDHEALLELAAENRQLRADNDQLWSIVRENEDLRAAADRLQA